MLIDITDDDARTVRAILLTHAEMQDRQALANEALRGNEEDQEVVEDLSDMHEDLIEDRDNLKRIADFFGKE